MSEVIIDGEIILLIVMLSIDKANKWLMCHVRRYI